MLKNVVFAHLWFNPSALCDIASGRGVPDIHAKHILRVLFIVVADCGSGVLHYTYLVKKLIQAATREEAPLLALPSTFHFAN